MEKKIERRIGKELSLLRNSINKGEITGLDFEIMNENPRYIKLKVSGPDNSPYAGGIFNFHIWYHERFPINAPEVLLRTRIYHPNISPKGDVCLNILKGDWTPIIQLRTLALSLRGLLESPNLDDPLNINATEHFKRDIESAAKTAQEWTELYAKPK